MGSPLISRRQPARKVLIRYLPTQLQAFLQASALDIYMSCIDTYLIHFVHVSWSIDTAQNEFDFIESLHRLTDLSHRMYETIQCMLENG